MDSKTIPLIILAGGQGTRLRAFAPDVPKPMVPIYHKPFIHWLIQHYVKQGFKQFFISTGYLAEVIEKYPFKKHFPKASFKFYREAQPLGTGGAVLQVFKNETKLQRAWIINGDTLLACQLPCKEWKNKHAVYIALQPEELFDATANLVVDKKNVTAVQTPGHYFDAGAVYVQRKALQYYTGKTKCALHKVLSKSMKLRQVGYHVVPGKCYDIGTQARYKRFKDFLKCYMEKLSPLSFQP